LSEEEISHVQVLPRDPGGSTWTICERFEIWKATVYSYARSDRERRLPTRVALELISKPLAQNRHTADAGC
jgi:hypothetical protein